VSVSVLVVIDDAIRLLVLILDPLIVEPYRVLT